MVIYLGNKKPIKLYFDETEIGGVYLGTNPIYIPSEESDESDSDVEPDDTLIDENTLGVWHFENNLDNAVSGSSIGINTNHNYTFTNEHHKFDSYSTLISDRISSSGTYDLFTNYLSSISENFTFDFWAQQYSTTAMERIWFSLGTGQKFTLYIGQDKISWTGSNQMTITNGVWYHLAIELQENTLRFYVNGELKYTNSNFTYSHDLWYGYVSSSYNHNVYLDEFRLSNIARYRGENFTPPDQQYHY